MLEEILVTTKDLQIGDVLNDKKIVDLTKRDGFVLIFFDDDKDFSFGENINITIRRDCARDGIGNPDA